MPEKSASLFRWYAFSAFAVFLLLSLATWQSSGGNLFGKAGHFTGWVLIRNLLGMTAFALPAAILSVSIHRIQSGGETQKLLGRSFKLFLALFFINVLLINGPLRRSDWAGLFPYLVQALLFNYFGRTGSILVECFLCLAATAWYFHSLSESIKQFAASNFKSAAGFLTSLTSWFSRHSKLTFQPVHPQQIAQPYSAPEIITRVKTDEQGLFVRWDADEQSENIAIFKDEDDTDTIITESSENETSFKVNRQEESKPSALLEAPETIKLPDSETGENSSEVDFDLSAHPFFTNAPVIAGDEEVIAEDSNVASQIVVPDTAIPSLQPAAAVSDPSMLRKSPAVINRKSLDIDRHMLADISALEFGEIRISSGDKTEVISRTARKLEETIREFGINAKVVEVFTGPVITRYEITIEAGIKVSRIANLSDNIALSLAAPSVRIVAPIPGKSVIGIEIPNEDRQMVRLRDVVDHPSFRDNKKHLPIALGKSLLGEPVIADLTAMPHLLVAGATGSGKSVCVNSIITSLLFKLPPSECRMLMIDPKMVELNIYNDIPHLLCPVITDARRAAMSLRWVISEMEARYCLLEKFAVRSIKNYNHLVSSPAGKKACAALGLRKEDYGTLPYIVVVIDEFADLMMVARKEVEDSVTRLAAMSRAVGIHLILATQRPSVDVITGIIKANFPSRIAFQVSSKIDSRTILDGSGAEKLLGKGDMLFQTPASSMPERIQGTFLSDNEVKQVVENLVKLGKADYIPEVLSAGEEDDDAQFAEASEDPLFDDAVQIVVQDKKASASYLQRKLKIGYNRAARMVEKMEELNLIGAQDGSRPREVLINSWK